MRLQESVLGSDTAGFQQGAPSDSEPLPLCVPMFPFLIYKTKGHLCPVLVQGVREAASMNVMV